MNKLLFILSFFAFSQASSPFEGKLEYSIDVDYNEAKESSLKYYEGKYGGILEILLWADGDFVMLFPDSDKKYGLEYLTFDSATSIRLVKFRNSQEVHSYYCNATENEVVQLSYSKIEGHKDSTQLALNIQGIDKTIDKEYDVDYYFENTDLVVDPIKFNLFSEKSFNRVLTKTGLFYSKRVDNSFNGELVITYNLTSFEEKLLDKSDFPDFE